MHLIFIIKLLLFNNLRIYKIWSLVLPELRSRHINRNGCEKTTFWKYLINLAVHSNASTEISKSNITCNLKVAHVMRVFLSCPIFLLFRVEHWGTKARGIQIGGKSQMFSMQNQWTSNRISSLWTRSSLHVLWQSEWVNSMLCLQWTYTS